MLLPVVHIRLYNGEVFTTERYDIEVSYQYGNKTNERTTKTLTDFITSPFYVYWYAQHSTAYTIRFGREVINFVGAAIGTFRVIR